MKINSEEFHILGVILEMMTSADFFAHPVSFGLVIGELSSFCLLFLAVNHSKAGNKLGLRVGLVLGLGISSGIVLGIRLGQNDLSF